MYGYRFSNRYAGRTNRNTYYDRRRAAGLQQDFAAQARAAAANIDDPRWVAFKEVQPTIAAWIEAKSATFDFAASLFGAVLRHGDLTANQYDAVERCIERDKARSLPQSPEFNNGVDQTAIRTLLAGRHKVTVAGFTFSMASATSRNPGAIYVKFRGEYVGKVLAGVGEFYPASAFDRSQMDALRAIFANPNEAVRADAADRAARLRANPELTIPCGCCGIILTDPVSVARGIGPICAGKWGF